MLQAAAGLFHQGGGQSDLFPQKERHDDENEADSPNDVGQVFEAVGEEEQLLGVSIASAPDSK